MKTEKNRLMDVKTQGVKWFSLALCLTAGFSLFACSDDDDEGGSGEGTPAQQPPKVSDVGFQFPVTQYSNGYNLETYNYSDGRMTGATSNNGNYTISYNPLRLKSVNGSENSELINIKVNDSGFMTYADYSHTYSYYDEYYFEKGYLTFSYDAEGHLVNESLYINESSDGPYSCTLTYTWENGNMVKSVYKDNENWSEVCTLAYENDQWTNSGVFTESFLYAGMMGEPVIYFSGLLGRLTRLIPTSMVDTDSDGYVDNYVTQAVNYNPDRSISSIVENENGYSYTTYFGYVGYPIQQQSGYSAAPAWKSTKAVHGMKARRMMKRK